MHDRGHEQRACGLRGEALKGESGAPSCDGAGSAMLPLSGDRAGSLSIWSPKGDGAPVDRSPPTPRPERAFGGGRALARDAHRAAADAPGARPDGARRPCHGRPPRCTAVATTLLHAVPTPALLSTLAVTRKTSVVPGLTLLRSQQAWPFWKTAPRRRDEHHRRRELVADLHVDGGGLAGHLEADREDDVLAGPHHLLVGGLGDGDLRALGLAGRADLTLAADLDGLAVRRRTGCRCCPSCTPSWCARRRSRRTAPGTSWCTCRCTAGGSGRCRTARR